MSLAPVPPYRRIADDLRRRIVSGELSPGDRVPSARRLAGEWNVALATATKAVGVLRQEGLLRAQMRVGTIVAPRRTKDPQRRSELIPKAPEPGRQEVTRLRVIDTAIAIADAEGIAGLSMRAVAGRLGVATMTPYRHVASKDELILAMADRVLGDLDSSGWVADGWRHTLEQAVRALWVVHRGHPWLAHIGPLTRPLLVPNLMAYSDAVLRALEGRGLDAAAMLDVNVLLYSHVQGLAIQIEREAQAESATGLTDQQWLDRQETALGAVTDSGDYPTFTRVIASLGPNGYDLRVDTLFELGLTSILDGLSKTIDGVNR